MEITSQATVTQRATTITAEADSVRYVAQITDKDGSIVEARCSVNTQQQIDGIGSTWMYVGTIIYANGSISTLQLPLADTAKYVAAFSEIMAEYEKGGAAK